MGNKNNKKYQLMKNMDDINKDIIKLRKDIRKLEKKRFLSEYELQTNYKMQIYKCHDCEENFASLQYGELCMSCYHK